MTFHFPVSSVHRVTPGFIQQCYYFLNCFVFYRLTTWSLAFSEIHGDLLLRCCQKYVNCQLVLCLGAPGFLGDPGSTGSTGATGFPGLVGATGFSGPPGPGGFTGQPGSQGLQGIKALSVHFCCRR